MAALRLPWCRPGDPCHADVLLEVANRPQPSHAVVVDNDELRWRYEAGEPLDALAEAAAMTTGGLQARLRRIGVPPHDTATSTAATNATRTRCEPPSPVTAPSRPPPGPSA